MCRLFGSLSAGEFDLKSHLLSSKTSLLVQGDANPKRRQGDGWGIGHFGASGRPTISLSTKAVYREKKLFAEEVGNASGGTVIAHIRRASNPRGLARSALLRPENQQPFAYKKWLFAHNGTVRIPNEVLQMAGRHQRSMKGNNDSEVYFRLLMNAIERTGSVRDGIQDAVEAIWKAWKESPADVQKIAERPYVGLNFILSDRESLYALCKYDGWKPEKDDNWLCHPRPPRPLFEMCYRVEPDGKGIAVASEITQPGGKWMPLKDGNLLEARLERGLVQLTVSSIG
jgi:predicted glutamine amidotransferase